MIGTGQKRWKVSEEKERGGRKKEPRKSQSKKKKAGGQQRKASQAHGLQKKGKLGAVQCKMVPDRSDKWGGKKRGEESQGKSGRGDVKTEGLGPKRQL